MADAAVEFLLENLKQLLLYHGNLIVGVKDQIVRLEEDLRLFKAFLRDSTKKRRKDDSLKELVKQIRDVVYDAEDIIDDYVTQVTKKQSSSKASIIKNPIKLVTIAKQVEIIRSRVQKIQGDKTKLDFANLNFEYGGPDAIQFPKVREDNIVGFEDEVLKLTEYIKGKTEKLDVISIIGMPGLGKTTLAGLIFRDPNVTFHFPTRIWIYISQEFTNRNVFLAILKEFITISDDMYKLSDDELAERVKSHLQSKRFLIVMDDVWTAEDWEKLQLVLPMNNNMGKVLITSRHVEVGRMANRNREPHMLRFLTRDEGLLLLRYEVFGKREFPEDLKNLGLLIVDRCAKLPLAIVVIGGILAKKFSPTENLVAMKNAWIKVSESVSDHLINDDPTRRMETIIALSYDKLPYHLRACFLYLAMFPEDSEISARNLTRAWIAEGFIQQKGSISLEETAESYLDELINRNLLRVDKWRRDGKVKTCRIHDMLRDFCISEAGNEKENFLQEIKMSNDGCFVPPVSSIVTFRRLCIHSHIPAFIGSKPEGPRVRSFTCFSTEDINVRTEDISKIPIAFKLLRVLEAKPLKFSKVPSELYHLVHLKYIAISFNVSILPQAFSKLWNIETLIVDTTSRTLEIKADIWKMFRLRHLNTNASAILPKPGKSSEGFFSSSAQSSTEGEKIQTVGKISPQSCTEAVFDKLRNVKSLAIRGKLAHLLDVKTGSFDSLGKLSHIEKLKLINDVFPYPASEGKLHTLPSPYQFPPKLVSLTLSNTFLDWTRMNILGLLENLQILKLKNKAFMGKIWEANDGGFRNLQVLYIGHTDLAIWRAQKHHFPRVRSLELRNCEYLGEIPLDLAEIPTFHKLDLYRSKSAAASAKEILKKKQENQTAEMNIFKLSIFPIDE